MSKLSKHLGKGIEIEIEGDKLELKPLTTEQLPLFFKVMKGMAGATKDKPEDAFKNMDEESMKALQQMIDITLKKSFPDETEEVRKEFGMKYWGQLFEKIIEMNSAVDEREKGKLDTIKRMQDESKRTAGTT